MKRRKVIVLGSSICAAVLTIAAYAAIPTILAVGNIAHSEVFDGPATVTVRQLIITPGEALPWHYHPGIVFNVVKRGTLTVEDGCGGRETLHPGEAFEELHAHIHRGRNLSQTPGDDVEVYNTFVVPEGLPTTVNTPANQQLCGPPITLTDCKNDGWAKFTFPQAFANQGDCEHYVITGK